MGRYGPAIFYGGEGGIRTPRRLRLALTELLHHPEMCFLWRRLARGPSLRHLTESDHNQGCGY